MTEPWKLQCPARGPGLTHVKSVFCNGFGEHQGHGARTCCECGRVPSVPSVGPADPPRGVAEPRLREGRATDSQPVPLSADEVWRLLVYVAAPEHRRGYR